ncbi:3-hydroxyacyl-CoA dehydrogenase NAD-binding domain-containing protein [Bacillus amyloliquefaciens]|uniref:3-hydroxyacyl-CoA dehydrogenase NAD-binding domain-containing protein n=1 Tax=Bacillus amyloliquefaciens TaxID=1390 RepID=UPI002452A563|nr:3-hydroxyacyl-CoA dehydrogenase NAD-binding domain-containing protein [Bacillus amyloliquefaciens]MDH3090680.1 3-hydroxyacyl-CoA dehydrogenase NAD-binding domain-containing protein [Bacillus amyloliquefaciens]
MKMKTIMVAGAGQMGAGIAQTAAEAGFTVMLYDWEPEMVTKGLTRIKTNLEKDQAKGRKTQHETDAVFSRISPVELTDAGNADFVIEAIAENKKAKAELLGTLDKLCPPHTVLASNTSSLPITELVEVIRGLATSEETSETVKKLAVQMKKIPVEVNDFPGFISNRILMPMINEAVYCLYEGAASKEAIDEVMKLGMRHPMGPLTLADFIGLDTCLSIMEVLYSGLGDSKYRPCPLLRKYVSAGWLGKKSGRGFYEYNR